MLSSKPTSLMWTPQICRDYEPNDFYQWPWTQAKADLSKMPFSISELNLRELNIDWVLRSVKMNQLPNGKVPLIAVFVKSVSYNCCGADLVVKDPSGNSQFCKTDYNFIIFFLYQAT